MRIDFETLTGSEQETVSDLVMGYEGDARSGITIAEQVVRLFRWKRQGWPERVYDCNILAMVIGYQRARTHDV